MEKFFIYEEKKFGKIGSRLICRNYCLLADPLLSLKQSSRQKENNKTENKNRNLFNLKFFLDFFNVRNDFSRSGGKIVGLVPLRVAPDPAGGHHGRDGDRRLRSEPPKRIDLSHLPRHVNDDNDHQRMFTQVIYHSGITSTEWCSCSPYQKNDCLNVQSYSDLWRQTVWHHVIIVWLTTFG